MKRMLAVILSLALVPLFFVGCRAVGSYEPINPPDVTAVTANVKQVSNVIIPVTLPANLVPLTMLTGLTKLANVAAQNLDEDSVGMTLTTQGQEISFGRALAYRENPDGTITLIFALPEQAFQDRGLNIKTINQAATASLNLGGNNVDVEVPDLSTQVVQSKVNEVKALSDSAEDIWTATLQETVQVAQQVVTSMTRDETGQITGNTGLQGAQKVMVYEVTINPSTGAVVITPTIVIVSPTAVKVVDETKPPVSFSAFVTQTTLNSYSGTAKTLTLNSDVVVNVNDAAFNVCNFKFTFGTGSGTVNLTAIPATMTVKIYDMTNVSNQFLLATLNQNDPKVAMSFAGNVLSIDLSAAAGNLLQPGKTYKTVFHITPPAAATFQYVFNGYFTFRTFLPQTVINLTSITASRFGTQETGTLSRTAVSVSDFPPTGGIFTLNFSQALTAAPTEAIVRFLDPTTGNVVAEYSKANQTLGTTLLPGGALTITLNNDRLQAGATYNVSFALGGFAVPEGTTVVISSTDVYLIKLFQTKMIDWTGSNSTATANRVNPDIDALELTFDHDLAPNNVEGVIRIERFVIGATQRESMYTYGLGATENVTVQGKKIILLTKDRELVPERRYVISYVSGTIYDIAGQPVAVHEPIQLFTGPFQR